MNEYFSASEGTIQYLKQLQTLLDQLHPEAEPQARIVPGSPQPRGTIVVFPGSFNPPTSAHLALLKQARQFTHQQGLAAGKENQTVQLYAAMSKHIVDKERIERPLLLDRLMLLHEVLQRHLPGAGIMLFNRGLYIEQAQAVRSSFPSLPIPNIDDTLPSEEQRQRPGSVQAARHKEGRGVEKLFFLLGFDKIVQILDPRYYADRDAALEKLFTLADLLVAPRGASSPEDLANLLRQPQNLPFAPYIHALAFDPAYRNISSTRIRKQGEAFSQDVPEEVLQFMRETHAYEPPVHQADGTAIDYYGERAKALEALLKKVNVEK